MGRGVSSGGGQSSLGYLFGGGESPKPTAPASQNVAPPAADNVPLKQPTATLERTEISKDIPAGIQEKAANNYFRADGQNTGNFITDRPSTKVHAAPGGGSSLGYLFGDGNSK
ncbi:hypothetical protein GIB67_009558 [Kingdonia uniflora]|uniref:Protein SPIRAL1-like 1 n=1 Tax=Kingdonia uniflora TaxID=39325 RepID=A0A7J7NW47_9MAGN|nr:hypothetical protein GIB67_009558 [Kingdonia uniflora]